MKNLYFVAHQDDELNNTGVLLTKEAAENYDDTYVILCTDGGASGVKNVLNDKKSCHLHEGTHDYKLSGEEFSLARDREFLESCMLLGVKKENTVIHSLRGHDGSLSESEATEIILDMLKKFPDEEIFNIRAVSPCFYGKQNNDHKIIGIICEKLFREGLFNELILVKDSCAEDDYRKIFPHVKWEEMKADEKSFEKIRAAADCYGRWEPDKKRYAVGWHSVRDEFEEIVSNPVVTFERLIRT